MAQNWGSVDEYHNFVEGGLLFFPTNKVLWVVFGEACDSCCDCREVFDELSVKIVETRKNLSISNRFRSLHT